MPHIPRRFAPTSGGRPDLPPAPLDGRPAAAYHKNQTAAAKPRERLLERLSIRTHRVDPNDVYKQLFGKEAKVDEHSGELV
jgi:hypothetical protein